ncbi:MAG TPA: cupin domain-containing protein [Dehalococcoidia bacterium]|nr:cupin domain-containing protein [Dehalococcoidia bacterium]
MPDFEHKNLATPDETRTPPHAKLEIVNLAGGVVARATYAPGWRWSNDIKPIAGTDWCEVDHAGYIVSGRIHIKMAGGEELECGAGEIVTLTGQHDAWVIGNEPCVMIDWGAVANFGKA